MKILVTHQVPVAILTMHGLCALECSCPMPVLQEQGAAPSWFPDPQLLRNKVILYCLWSHSILKHLVLFDHQL
jgi:hypothetical protein